MRQIASSRIASRLQTSISPRPAILQSYGWEYRGDPGPSSVRTFANSSRDQLGGARASHRGSTRPSTGYAVAAGRGASWGARSGRDGGARGSSKISFGMNRSGEDGEGHEGDRSSSYDRGRGRGGMRGSTRGGLSSSRGTGRGVEGRSAAPVKLTSRQIASKQMESERPTDHQGDPHTTSSRISEWTKKRQSPINPKEVDELIRMVKDAPRYRVNTVVWNQVLSILGREHLLHSMWSAFNSMKKRGSEPNSRTYTIMLNAFAGARHMDDPLTFNPAEKPSERKWQRILAIYNESQTYIMTCINRLKEEKSGSTADAESGIEIQGARRPTYPLESLGRAETRAQISPTPTNAYIKLLARYGMWDQLDKVHLAMDKEGPLSPNTRTYQMLFAALLDRRAQQTEKRYAAVKDDMVKPISVEQFGSTARLLWEEMVRRFHPVTPPEDWKADETRMLDQELAVTAIRALMTARPMDHQLGLNLMGHIWRLPQYESAVTASATSQATPALIAHDRADVLPGFMRKLPKLPLTNSTAATLLTLLNRANKKTAAVTWSRYIYENRSKLRGEVTFDLARSMIFAAGAAGDQDFVSDIMDTYQPPTGKAGWAAYMWENAMTASWAQGDFDRALSNFRKMTHLPYGTEDGEPEDQRRKYAWHRPRKQETDINGNVFYRPEPQRPTPRVMSLLVRSAFGTNSSEQVERNARKAYNVFTAYPIDHFFTIDADEFKRGVEINLLKDRAENWDGEIHASLQHAAEWRINLAKDVKKVTEYLITSAKEEEKKELKALGEIMTRVVNTWGARLAPVQGEKTSSDVKTRQGSISAQGRQSGMPSTIKSVGSAQGPKQSWEDEESGDMSDWEADLDGPARAPRIPSTRGTSRGASSGSRVGSHRGSSRGRGGSLGGPPSSARGPHGERSRGKQIGMPKTKIEH